MSTRRAAVPFVLLLSLAAAGPAAAQPAPPPGVIVDPESRCATSNPFPTGKESIRWTGGCRDGRLDGFGTLTWYRGGEIYERDEGTFRNGELHGEATITFADGSSIIGNYTDGRRNGEFIIIRDDGVYVRAVYHDDALISERELSRRQVRALLDERRRGDRGEQTPGQVFTRTTAAGTGSAATAASAAVVPAATVSGPSAEAPPPPRPAPPAAAAAPPATGSARQIALTSPAPWSPLQGGTAAVEPAATPPPPALSIGRMVCSAPGLYANEARWCGRIRQANADEYLVEVATVELNSVFAVGISSGECTGGEFLGWFARGTRVWVPQRCMR